MADRQMIVTQEQVDGRIIEMIDSIFPLEWIYIK